MPKPLKVGFVSLGCPKNLVDSEVMMGLLSTSGAQITPRAEDADVIVVNTCSFIDSAKQESVDTILEMAQHKTSGRAQKLIVAGCLVERYRSEIQKNIPEVDAVVGTGELENILAAAGVATPPADSPFRILESRPEAEAREQAGRFARDEWAGAITPRVCSRRPSTRLTSRSLKAAIILVRFASFLSSAASFVRGASSQ
jgi:ribosomal protein S12 methylthiotransferase